MIHPPDAQTLYAVSPIWLAWIAGTALFVNEEVDLRRICSALLILVSPIVVLTPAMRYLPVLIVAALLTAGCAATIRWSRDHGVSAYSVPTSVIACLTILTLAGAASDFSLAIVEPFRLRFYTACVYGVSLVFSVWFGAEIVRALLDRTGVPIPSTTTAGLGRAIGQLERAVLTVVIILGSLEALGFLVAAKGLVRSSEMRNDHSFAEYFLVGTLASVLVALGAALAARWALSLVH